MSNETNQREPDHDRENTGNISRRRPAYAVALSLVMAGLGHLYCGRLVAGFAWAAAGSSVGIVSLSALASNFLGYAAWVPIWAVSIGSAIHAGVIAQRSPQDYRLQPMNHWIVYTLFVLIGSFGATGYAALIRREVVQAYVTPSNDMNPIFEKGDRFLVDKTAFNSSPAGIGDVVVFKNPENAKQTYVKRILAMSGDVVEIRQGVLMVNDEPVGTEWTPGSVPDYGPITVPEFNCFVVGDNLPGSRDSRHFGPIPNVTIGGRATFLFWPQGSWSRFGAVE